MALGRKTQQDEPAAGVIATRQPAAQPPAPQDDAATAAPIPAKYLARIDELVSQIPESGDTESWGMLESLLTAETMQDLNRPWQSTSGRDLAGKRVMITSVTRRPSEFDSGAGVFLVVNAMDMATGENITFTTGAVMVIMQLAAAAVKGWLPIVADITAAKKPTAKGFVPYHLNVTEIRAGK